MENKTLPDGWQWKKLGEICDFEGGSQPPKEEFSYEYKDGYVRLIQIRDYKSDDHIVYVNTKSVRRFCNKDDVMIGRYGPPVFQILRGIEGAYNVALMKAIPKRELVDNDYLFWFLQNDKIQSYVINLSQRSAGQSGVDKAALEKYLILLPPLEEQKRIVAKIDAAFEQLDEAISLQKNNILRTETLKKALLVEQFSELPYEKKKLGEVIDVRDGTHDSPKYVIENKYPFVTSKNLKESGLDLANTNFISEEDFTNFNKRSKVEKGDLLFAMIGTVGNPVIINVEPNFAIKNVALFKKNESLIKITFLRYFLLSPLGTDKMLDEANGATQKFVSLKYLRNFEIPLPPIAEQEKIVAYLDKSFDQIDEMLEAQKTRLAHLEGMKKAILQEAFEGKL